MIRFKVIKASRLLLGLAIIVLLVVLIFIAVNYSLTRSGAGELASARLVRHTVSPEAKAVSAFASGNLPLDPRDSDTVEIEVLRDTPKPTPTAPVKPSVLIYHTHTHEAYEQVSADPYPALEAWRTLDEGHSVVRVGKALADALTERGFEVVHDTTDHENDALSTAYTRSLQTLERYQRSFDLYIDLHRDAWFNGMQMRYKDDSGFSCAQLMLLIGNGNGFDVKPYYKENYAFARALTDCINADHPGLCKKVLVKDGRYNQHIGIFSILVEVGHNKNTLREALDAVPMLADALRAVWIDAPDPDLMAMRADAA